MTEHQPPPFDRAAVEIIETTELFGRDFNVTTARYPGQYLLRPFKICLVNNVTGETRYLADYSCAASAAHGHQHWVRTIREEPV